MQFIHCGRDPPNEWGEQKKLRGGDCIVFVTFVSFKTFFFSFDHLFEKNLSL